MSEEKIMKTGVPKKAFSLFLDEANHEKVFKLAAKQKRSVARIINMMIEESSMHLTE